MKNEQEARQAVLDALFTGTPLPGGVQPLLFPDSSLLSDPTTVLLVQSPSDEALVLHENLTLITPEELASAQPDDKPLPVLEFLLPENFPGRVSVRLRVSRLDAQGRLLPLGEVIATFTTDDGVLTVTEPTHVLAL